MSKKILILISFFLALAVNAPLQAATTIDVNNYSFELDKDHQWITSKKSWETDELLAWKREGTGFMGVDLRTWEGFSATDGNCWGYSERVTGDLCYQVLDPCDANDPTNDVNSIITDGKMYTLTVDMIGWGDLADDTGTMSLFYPLDPCAPDVNHIEIASKTLPHTAALYGQWQLDQKLRFVAQAGQAYIGKPIGIKLSFPGPAAVSDYSGFDKVRLDWQWATQAYNPDPENGAMEVPKDANLAWSPGGWAKSTGGHDVYFGTSWADVNSATTASAEFKGNQDSNEYDPGTMVLGDTYYWRVDEVNENYTPGPVPYPPNGRWKGDIWSFTVEGRAKNPDPEDGAIDVPKNVVLHWSAGAEAKYHDVYFGTDETTVENATTSDPEYKDRLNLGTEEYDAEALVAVGNQYFWRIDEVSVLTVKGYVWDFTVADWLLVDDFDRYANPTELRDVWEDGWTNGTESQVLVCYDADFAVDGNSMQFEYYNDNKDTLYSEATRSYSTAKDWSYAGEGVTALELDFFGDVNSVLDPPMYVKLSDGTNTAQVNHPDPNDVLEEELHTWVIPLADFSGVTLSNISSITVGMGPGAKQSGATKDSFGTVYFDDFRLYPPRCFPEYGPAADFTNDCVVDNLELDIMSTDWLVSDYNTLGYDAELTDFDNDPCQWHPSGGIINGALEFVYGNENKVTVYDPNLAGITSMTITAWIKAPIPQSTGYAGIVYDRPGNADATGLDLGSDGDMLGYVWNEIRSTWQWNSGLYLPNDKWTFVAMVVEPTQATLYVRADGNSLDSATNVLDHPPLEQFDDEFMIGRGRPDGRYYEGLMDDVRIYDHNLASADINNLAYRSAEPCEPPTFWYKFDETSGYVASDSGSGGVVYHPVPSIANLTDPEPKYQRYVNFKDFAVLADAWLDEQLWPLP